MKNLTASLVLFPALATSASAALSVYTPDANTVYLYHLDETSGATAANAVSGGRSAYAVSGANTNGTNVANVANPQAENTNILNGAGFSGFGRSAILTGGADRALGVDGNGSGAYQMGNTNVANSPDAVLQSSFSSANGSFTIDAMINISTITTGNQQIASTDGNGNVDRGFQFRIGATGNLEFNQITGGGNALVAIPTTGPNAFVANEWFHVAAVVDGSAANANNNNISFYWTRVDATFTSANLIGTAGDTIISTINSPLVFGNENRGSFSEGLAGSIDEIRVSNSLRGAGDFIFQVPEPSTALLGAMGALALFRRRRA